ncbi:MAG: GNAT family N-acetyltransferase [Ramlibacter sp.]|nr:GNAT family N-acetyltransferase [Ramlibacter sp.]
MPFVVRRAAESDAPALIEFRRMLFAETANMLWEPDEFVQTADDESKRIARLNARSNSMVLLAEEDARLVGVLTAVGGEVRRLRNSANLALGVAKSHWGHGVATQMLQHALEWSRASGLRRVELTVHTSNIRAVGVYLRCGFQVEGVRRSSLFVNGMYIDEYIMSVLNEL